MNYLVGEVNGQGHFQTFRSICDSSEIWAKRKGSKELGDAQARPMIRGYGGPVYRRSWTLCVDGRGGRGGYTHRSDIVEERG